MRTCCGNNAPSINREGTYMTDSPAAMLQDWMRNEGVKRIEFAARLGLHRSSVTLYLQGKRRPKPEIAQNIAALTGGAVPHTAWGHAA